MMAPNFALVTVKTSLTIVKLSLPYRHALILAVMVLLNYSLCSGHIILVHNYKQEKLNCDENIRRESENQQCSLKLTECQMGHDLQEWHPLTLSSPLPKLFVLLKEIVYLQQLC